jgi:radical SAM superfamily enzyme YgiQ (UPF0313 family)
MNIYWLNPPISVRSVIADTAWINFSYVCKEHNWIKPIIDWSQYNEVDQIVDHIVESKADIVCMSTYIWNERLCLEVAKMLKERVKELIIIRGGPQQSNFDNIDYNCHPIGTGELYLKELLNKIKNNDNSEVSSIVKERYNFPEESTYEYNIEYLTELVSIARTLNKYSTINIETTRGCPYACTYCEWGGGIGTKISQKQDDIVYKELDLAAFLGFNNIDIMDANFGILSRDINFMQRLADNKIITGHPNESLIYGIAKTKLEKKEAILDIAFEHGLMDSYSMSIQSISDIALKNVKRTDIPLEDNLKLAKKYFDKYGTFARIEIIIGLPGATIEDFYKEMDITLSTGGSWDWGRYVLCILPATELADPLYQNKYKIKTTYIGITENDNGDETFFSDNILSKYKTPQKVVIESYSFTKEHWKEMFFMNYAQRSIGPTLSPDQIPSIAMKQFYTSIQNEEWFKYLKSEIDLLADGKRAHLDYLLYDGCRIEEWVEKFYVNKERYNGSYN